MNYRVFNLTLDDVHCPVCYNTIKAITCGFTDCKWMYRGFKTGSEVDVTSDWHVAGDDRYEQFREAGKLARRLCDIKCNIMHTA
jgi:hypothetical protein